MNMGYLDYAVLIVYFAAVLTAGLWFGRSERDTKDFFLGGRKQHWLMVGVSIIATEVSALTFLIVPGRSYSGDWWYLQLYAGAFIGRILIIRLFLPAFYGHDVTTVYEYLGHRFGPWTRATASLMFFASRIVGSSIRLLAASLAIALLFHWPLIWVVIGAAGLAILYTTFGGIKAIIYTDFIQACVFLGGAVAVVVFLFYAIPGSWTENIAAANQLGKFKTFNWGWNFNNDKLFWVLIIHATFQNMAALGTDQDLTQRMLTCPDLKRSQRSLLFNALAGLPVVCLFLLIGTLIFLYEQQGIHVASSQMGGAGATGGLPASAMLVRESLLTPSPDKIFAHFIGNVLPAGYGLKGLLVAGIFAAAMSSLDSALGALSSTAVTDVYRRYIKPYGSDRHYLIIARLFTVYFGILLAVVALSFAGTEDLLEEAFGWVGLIFGGMLGMFLLGVTTKTRGSDAVNVFAMISSVALLITLKAYQQSTNTLYLAWPWWVVVGTIWTYFVGCCCKSNIQSK